jgi:hypothetical protein
MQLRTLGFNLLFFTVFIASFHNSNLLPCFIFALFVSSFHGGSVDVLLFQFIVNQEFLSQKNVFYCYCGPVQPNCIVTVSRAAVCKFARNVKLHLCPFYVRPK